MDEANKIVICKHCEGLEYYGEMRWIDGKTMCRQCYKHDYERVNNRRYEWTDLDGPRPSQEDFIKQGLAESVSTKTIGDIIYDFKCCNNVDVKTTFNQADMCLYLTVIADGIAVTRGIHEALYSSNVQIIASTLEDMLVEAKEGKRRYEQSRPS